MATLAELLANNNPDQLKTLLGGAAPTKDPKKDFEENVLPAIQSQQPLPAPTPEDKYSGIYQDNYARLKQGNVNLPDAAVQQMAISAAEAAKDSDTATERRKAMASADQAKLEGDVSARLSGLGIKVPETAKPVAPASVTPVTPSTADDSDEDDSEPTKTKHSETVTTKTKRFVNDDSDANKASGQALVSTAAGAPGFTNNTVENLKAAQDAANKQKNTADMMKAVNQITSGLTGAAYHTGAPSTAASDKFQDDQKAEADNSIKQFQDLNEKEKDDPASTYSVGMREFAKPLMAKLGIAMPDNMSATQMASVSPMLVKMYDAKQADQTNRLKAQELSETRRIHDEMINESRQDKAEAKSKVDSDKAYTDLRKNVETFRGNKGAQQASGDVLSADKALTIVKNKDPNTLTTQDLGLLAGELSKIATGGVPTEHGIHELMPSNLKTKFAEMQNFLLSKPTDAQAAAYIRKNMAYLDEMKNVAKGTLNQYRANIARGYLGRVRPEQKDEFNTDYPELQPLFQRGTNVSAEPASAAKSHRPGDVVTYKGKQYRIGQDGDTLEPL